MTPGLQVAVFTSVAIQSYSEHGPVPLSSSSSQPQEMVGPIQMPTCMPCRLAALSALSVLLLARGHKNDVPLPGIHS